VGGRDLIFRDMATTPTEPVEEERPVSFAELGLSSEVLKAVEELGYEAPTRSRKRRSGC